MNRYTSIPSAIQYKASPSVDQSVQLGLEQQQREIIEYDRTSTVELNQVYDNERQASTIFRPTFKVTYLYDNTYSGTTDYIPFRNNLWHVAEEQSVVSGIWGGFPQFYEFDFYRPNIPDNHLDYRAKSAYTYNWTFYLSYPVENNENQVFNTTLCSIGSWVAKDGIPFTIKNITQNGQELISFECISEHGLAVGEFVKLPFSYKQEDLFQVHSLGDDTFLSSPFIFNILNVGYTGTTFQDGVVGTFRRVINAANELETTSKYYVRRHKILTNVEDLIVTKAGFEKNVFQEQRKLELSSLTPNNINRIVQKTSSNAYNFTVAKDLDIIDLIDNQKRPITELFLTIVFKGYSGYFNESSNGIGIKQGWQFNLSSETTSWWATTNFNSNTNIPLQSYTKTSGTTKTFYYNSDLSKGDIMDGDFCEWNDYQQIERVISPYYHKIKYNQNVFTTTILPNPNAPGFYYKPYQQMNLRFFSDYVDEGPAESVVDIPSYSYYSQADQSFRWRDLYQYGFFDNLNRGVDYPYLNKAHYPYQNVIFRLIPEGINYNNVLGGINYPIKPLIDACE
jgi:hypothetical protein